MTARKAPKLNSQQFSERMKEAAERLAIDFRAATALSHPTGRGSKREESVCSFLEQRLPGFAFATNGFAYDAYDTVSGELDIFVYRERDAPFLLPGPPPFVVCESLLAVIEVKSMLNAAELRNAFNIAKSIRELKPFNKTFVDARRRGLPRRDDEPRCFFSIFAFQ